MGSLLALKILRILEVGPRAGNWDRNVDYKQGNHRISWYIFVYCGIVLYIIAHCRYSRSFFKILHE